MIRIKKIDHVVIRARDLEDLVRFYTEILGCAVAQRNEPLGLVHLRAGSSQIDLVDVAGEIGRRGGGAPGAEGLNMDHFCLRVEPFDEASIRAHLEARGVECGPLQTRFGAKGDGPSLYIEDPEGNTVELTTWADEAAFDAWVGSADFRDAHRDPLPAEAFDGEGRFERHEVVISAEADPPCPPG